MTRDSRGRTPYLVASTKEVRDTFRCVCRANLDSKVDSLPPAPCCATNCAPFQTFPVIVEDIVRHCLDLSPPSLVQFVK